MKKIKGALAQAHVRIFLLYDHDLPPVHYANERPSTMKGTGEIIQGKFHAAINELAGEIAEKEQNEEVVRRGEREIQTRELEKDKSPARRS